MTLFGSGSSSLPTADFAVSYVFAYKPGSPGSYYKLAMNKLVYRDAADHVYIPRAGSGAAELIVSLDTNATGFGVRDSQIRAGNNGSNQTYLSFWLSNAADPVENYRMGLGSFRPAIDNARSSGEGSYRWTVVYAQTGTINTSDEREKTWRSAPTSAEIAAANDIFAELGFYQWNDAIAEKGASEARLHFGARAQRVWTIMVSHGLIDPITVVGAATAASSKYAFLCFDSFAGGNRFGLRDGQLALFLMAGLNARLAALEAA
jgi:hypothetical protein